MKKSIKRTLSLLLALTMVLSLGLPAYAVGAPEDDAVVVTEEPVELPEQEPVEEPVEKPVNLPIGAGKQPGIIEEDETISDDLIVDIVDEETAVEEEVAPAKVFCLQRIRDRLHRRGFRSGGRSASGHGDVRRPSGRPVCCAGRGGQRRGSERQRAAGG